MAWMAWTLPTALFFSAIALVLLVLGVAQRHWPTVARRGFLPLATTRGDRFFISLLTAALIHLGWLAVTDLPVPGASALALFAGAVIMAKG
ncbi:MAG: DUF2160 domain-containing protein [Pseudomonadales bacterium]|nr:DUF2160 domain-containing protein [Pseudomonadales bacterium]MCP5184013.1 DUF2160 domain-containing protein [Pseudomonadales bacterium]